MNKRAGRSLNVELRPVQSYQGSSVSNLIESLKTQQILVPEKALKVKRKSLMKMKELREFLHYSVLLPRATLPYQVSFDVLSKLLSTTISMEEAKSLLKIIKRSNFPLLQAKHRLFISPDSLKLVRNFDEPSQCYRNKGSSCLQEAFIDLHSNQSKAVNVSNLFCTRVQKTIDATGRVSSLQE